MTAKVPRGCIPTAPLVPTLKAYVASQPEGVGTRRLTEAAGFSDKKGDFRTLYRILSGERKWISFDVADRMICHAIGDPAIWYTPELRDVYLNCDLSEPEPIPADYKCMYGHGGPEVGVRWGAPGRIQCRVCSNERNKKRNRKKVAA